MAKNNNQSFKKKLNKRCKEASKFVQYKWLFPLAFKLYSIKPVDENLVVFADERDRDMPDNFLSLYEMCQEKGYRCVFLSGKSFGESVSGLKQKIEKFRFNLKFMKLYAQCRAIFLVEYVGIAYVTKARPKTQVIQLWHACGMIKNIAYSAFGSKWSPGTLSPEIVKRYPMHNTYTLVCGASPRLCRYYADAFRCSPEITQPLGCPRTDIYYDEEFKKSANEKVRQLIPQIKGRKIIVYAPTFRGTSIKKSYVDAEFDYVKMNERLSEEYVFLTKFHPLLAKGGLSEAGRLQASDFVFDISDKLTAEEAVCVADILISD